MTDLDKEILERAKEKRKALITVSVMFSDDKEFAAICDNKAIDLAGYIEFLETKDHEKTQSFSA